MASLDSTTIWTQWSLGQISGYLRLLRCTAWHFLQSECQNVQIISSCHLVRRIAPPGAKYERLIRWADYSSFRPDIKLNMRWLWHWEKVTTARWRRQYLPIIIRAENRNWLEMHFSLRVIQHPRPPREISQRKCSQPTEIFAASLPAGAECWVFSRYFVNSWLLNAKRKRAGWWWSDTPAAWDGIQL